MPEKIKFKILKFYRSLPFCLPHVLLHPLFNCNYACSYCTIKRYLNGPVVSQYRPFSEWIKAFDALPRSTITITGGEPLLYPGLSPLLLGLSKRHIVSQVVSNLSLDLKPLFDAKRAGFRIMASYHPDCADLQEFISKVIELRNGGFSIMVNYVAALSNLKRARELHDIFNKKYGIFFKIDTFEDAAMDDLRIYSGKDINVPVYGLNEYADKRLYDSYSPKVCSGGYKFFVIISNGDVYRCNGGFKYCNMPAYRGLLNGADHREFYLGNILKDEFRPFSRRKDCHAPCKSMCDIPFATVKVK